MAGWPGRPRRPPDRPRRRAGRPGPRRVRATDLQRLADADLMALPAVGDGRLARAAQETAGPPAPPSGPDRPAAFPPDLLEALRAAVDRGARVLSICSGAFILGEAGLLDGRRCTTHWRHAAELARRFPQAKVDPDVL